MKIQANYETRVKSLYENHSYPNPRYYKLNREKPGFHISGPAPFNVRNKRIMVVGCGCIEANLVANANPQSTVFGIDFSRPSIRISKSIARKYKMNNLTLLVGGIEEIDCNAIPQFDYVIASGVLHHIPNVHVVLSNISNLLVEGGLFTGMVYSDKRPSFIRRLNEWFNDMLYDVYDVREFFEKSRNEEPEAFSWYWRHDPSDEEVADTWLHPYFVEYSPKELKKVLERHFDFVETWYNKTNDTKLMFRASGYGGMVDTTHQTLKYNVRRI